MPNFQQIENPQGAFGLHTTVNTPPFFHSRVTRRYRNMSTAVGIPSGACVVRAVNSTEILYGTTAAGVLTGSTIDEGVFVTTVGGHPGIVGVTITTASARTTGSTLGVAAPSSEYVTVVEEGPAWVLMSTVFGRLATTVIAAGDFVTPVSATASGGSTVGVSRGGIVGVPSTVSVTTARGTSVGGYGEFIGILGQVIVAPSSGSTGQLTSQFRGLVWVKPQVVMTGVAGAVLSSA